MRLLLDTHTLLWWLGDRAKLSPAARHALGDPTNDVNVSVVSIWEIAIKAALGRLVMPADLLDVLGEDGLTILTITAPHALATQGLPSIHKDPFDRLLVAQAMIEGLTLVTRDPHIRSYPVATLLA